MPKVSIGLPVYNGENFIEEAIESLLSQTFSDFEIIICDNQSTDKTESICRAFEEKDSRIRYYRNSKNLGASPNFNRCVELATGTYFKWAAHDDICLPEYLQECVNCLDRNNLSTLCHSSTLLIDANQRVISDYKEEDGKFSSPDPIKRFENAIDERHQCITVFGVIRRELLVKTTLIESYIGSDRNLIAQLSLLGPILHVDRALFLSRDHNQRSVRALDVRERGRWFDSSKPVSGKFYYCTMLAKNIKALFSAPLGTKDRFRGFIVVTNWVRRSNLRNIAMEISRYAWHQTPLPAARATWRRLVK
jgi:glycosyltransferase involved in cell wall biosynthesis